MERSGEDLCAFRSELIVRNTECKIQKRESVQTRLLKNKAGAYLRDFMELLSFKIPVSRTKSS